MNYILWVDYGSEGWVKVDCDSIEQCYREAITHAAHTFVITPPAITVLFSEAK